VEEIVKYVCVDYFVSACAPIISTGVEALDRVLFCVNSYGITVLAVAVAFVFLLLIFSR
jgi:hypothetical protein